MKRTRTRSGGIAKASTSQASSAKLPRLDGPSSSKEVPERERQRQRAVCWLDRLPDHLVLRIFDDLDRQEIAAVAPRVCRRWSRLLRDETLWRDGSLYYSPHMPVNEKDMFAAFLKIAPVLGNLTIEWRWNDQMDFMGRLVDEGPRSIKVLDFYYDNYPPPFMVPLLKKHRDSLEQLIISDTYSEYSDQDVKSLWQAIESMSKLRTLVVQGSALFYHKATLRKAAPCWKSLRTLDVRETSYDDCNTVQKLVGLNGNLLNLYLGDNDSFRQEVKAIMSCVSLERVHLPFCKELKVLERCTRLETLSIECKESTSKEVRGILPYISSSSVFPNLKQLILISCSEKYADLLMAFATTCSRLKTFTVSNEAPSCLVDAFRLLRGLEVVSLASLEALSASILDEIAAAFVFGDKVGVLPKLKALNLTACKCDAGCWTDAINRLKKRRPALKVKYASCQCPPKANHLDVAMTAPRPEPVQGQQEQEQGAVVDVEDGVKRELGYDAPPEQTLEVQAQVADPVKETLEERAADPVDQPEGDEEMKSTGSQGHNDAVAGPEGNLDQRVVDQPEGDEQKKSVGSQGHNDVEQEGSRVQGDAAGQDSTHGTGESAVTAVTAVAKDSDNYNETDAQDGHTDRFLEVFVKQEYQEDMDSETHCDDPVKTDEQDEMPDALLTPDKQ